MKKPIKLEWYAIINGVNGSLSGLMSEFEICYYNVLNEGFIEDFMNKVKREKPTSLEELKICLDSILMYHYWCKAEFETLIRPLISNNYEKEKKIDVYYQLEPNLDIMVDYINGKLNIIK